MSNKLARGGRPLVLALWAADVALFGALYSRESGVAPLVAAAALAAVVAPAGSRAIEFAAKPAALFVASAVAWAAFDPSGVPLDSCAASLFLPAALALIPGRATLGRVAWTGALAGWEILLGTPSTAPVTLFAFAVAAGAALAGRGTPPALIVLAGTMLAAHSALFEPTHYAQLFARGAALGLVWAPWLARPLPPAAVKAGAALLGAWTVLALPPPAAIALGTGGGLLLLGRRRPRSAPTDDVLRFRILLAVAAVSTLARLVHWGWVDRVWEDALITVRHAENAAAGAGLTHHPAHGRVHGFTSALSVMIPLAGESLLGGSGLACLRLASLAGNAAALWFGWRIAASSRLRLSPAASMLWLSVIGFDYGLLGFGMSGMETQVWAAVLLGGVDALLSRRPVRLGALLGLAVLARPDAALWLALGIGGSLAWGIRPALRTGIAAGATLAPWLLFTTLYYGSPAPQPPRAKAAGYRSGTRVPAPAAGFPRHALRDALGAPGAGVFLPFPNFRGHGLGAIPNYPRPDLWRSAAGILACLGMVVAGRRGAGVPALFVLAHLGFFALVGWFVFGWYLPGTLALGALFVALGLDSLGPFFGRLFVRAVANSVSFAFLAALVPDYSTDRAVQRLVDDGVRRKVGERLRELAAPGDYVCAECLGYLGYYSGLPFHDFPGLSSPRATAALVADGRDRFVAPIVERLAPRWVVLRERERGDPPGYELVERIRMSAADEARLVRWLPASTIDGDFLIYRRRAPAPR